MEDDGFTLVTGRKAANKKFKKTENGTHIRIDGSENDIKKAMKSAKIDISRAGLATFVAEKLEQLAAAAIQKSIRKFWLIGNGHFDGRDEPGAHQLALFLELSAHFHCDLVFQEPVCSQAEKNWLREQKIDIREASDTKIDIPEGISVLGMIHGEHELLEQFLEHNHRKIDNLIVIGNNYGGVDWTLSKLRAQSPRINEFFEKSSVTPFPEVYEPHGSAFSGTVIMSPVVD
ncbi:unnamed protein product [Caenorhabditis brenneri]